MAQRQEGQLPSMGRPEKVEQIPGVGPIRARCLRKAGYDTIESLQGASAETLAAVPGITDVKARQIAEFVLALPPAAGAVGPTPAPPRRPPREHPPAYATALSRDGGGALEQAAAPARPAAGKPRSPLQIAAVKVAGAAGWLLQSPQSDSFARGLARQLSKLVAVVGRLADGAPAGEGQEERALRLLDQCARILGDVTADSKAGPRKQAKLAGRIRARRRKLRSTLADDAGQ